MRAEDPELRRRALRGIGKESVFRQWHVQDAVLRRLGILSDATGKLSPDHKARHPNIKWRQMVDCRNVTSHGYLNVGPNIVWDVIVSDLPEVLAMVESEPGSSTIPDSHGACWGIADHVSHEAGTGQPPSTVGNGPGLGGIGAGMGRNAPRQRCEFPQG